MYTDEQKDAMRMIAATQTTRDLFTFKTGDALIVVGCVSTPFQPFEPVVATSDTEKGIFESRPFIHVTNIKGDRCVMHASRCVPNVY